MVFRQPDEPQHDPDAIDSERSDDSQSGLEDDNGQRDGVTRPVASSSPSTAKPTAGTEFHRRRSSAKGQKRVGTGPQRDSKRIKVSARLPADHTVGVLKEDIVAPRRHGPTPSPDSRMSLAKQPLIERQQPDRITTMAEAVGSPFAFACGRPKTLVDVAELAETAGALSCYQRRFALARLAQVYNLTCQQNGGKFSVVRKVDKAAAYETMIERTWGDTFPSEHRGSPKTKGGLIDAKTTAAVRWNKYKSKLLRFLEGGQRWLGLVDRHGWSVLALIAPDWDTSNSRLSLTDSIFKQKLTKSECKQLVREITAQRRRLFQDIAKTDVSILDVLVDPSHILSGEFLKAVEDRSADNDERRMV
ncbi:hypothetical protein LTR70_010118 [Exophiala xenobiotica]|uniref:Uncharacterized protein n=1 Tax=Lithohypha guttulata TaxID=1690604 RepID=A0ABR0JV37_9EURO|nr:hypothetical protein LTR24_010067 [Lithohypha guttulata]KAK5309636.1 hypothetical protein LTR70_010118 [Exophiala xenobiotica]